MIGGARSLRQPPGRMVRTIAALAAALAATLLSGPAVADVPYEVQIVGIEDDGLLTTLEGVSTLAANVERPPPSLAALKRRAEQDVPTLEEAMASFGYYAATVDYAITEGDPVAVTVTITPGPLYTLAAYDIVGSNPALSAGAIKVTAEGLGIRRNDPAAAAAVVAAERRLLSLLARQGYPLAKVLDRKVVVDHATRTMSVDVRIDTGPQASFGPIAVEGLDSVDEEYVRMLLPWREGETFDAGKVEEARRELVATGLFTAVRIGHAEEARPDRQLPMTLSVTEAKHRSIGGGLRYATEEGFGAQVFWEHRNLFGQGERLKLTGHGGETGFGAEASLRDPAFWDDPRNTLLISAEATREMLEAFDATRFGGGVSIERAITPELTASAGLTFEHSEIDEDGELSEFTLVGVPVGLTWDTSDDLLDPHSGNKLQLSATGYRAVAGQKTDFLVARVYDSLYLPLGDALVLANWGRLGFIFGDARADIPADKRLYGGGGGSVRGFGYQRLGPLDDDGQPLGGRSHVAFGTELRMRFDDSFGAVIFLEGGNVYEGSTPDFSEPLLWGAGAGFRYFTDFGPLRLDVAVPLNPRPGDDDFQIYVSLGQAF